MKPTAILFPVLVQISLTFVVLIVMGWARRSSLDAAKKSSSDDDVRIGKIAWSEQATKVNRNYVNQFELPVLFYAVVAFSMITGAVDMLSTHTPTYFFLTGS